jgi:uncharacterized protein YndB with AHSA1/START domain
MNDHTFVYVLHIRTTPEQLWDALTRNEFWQQYWGGEWQIDSDWRAGSAVTFRTRDGELFSTGEVVTSDPPTTLAYTWPNPEPEQGAGAPERLTWRITKSGPGTVALELTHEHLTDEYAASVGRGWGAVLSSLKTLLETGAPLAFDPRG